MTAERRTLVIAEAGVNHNGDLDLARRLVDVAAQAGADIVKFQTFKASSLVGKRAPKAAYQQATTGQAESQYEMIRRLELDEPAHRVLVEHCRQHGIGFLSTPFDLDSLAFLTGEIGMSLVKIPSGEVTNAPFVLRIARAAGSVIVSSGMCTLSDIEQALGVLAFGFTAPVDAAPSAQAFERAYASDAGQQALRERVTLLHCTTEYPAPLGEINLRAMDTLGMAFGLPVGYSDHSAGIHVPLAAVARGARVIEKHFTLDRTMPGPDHRASLEPGELVEMVRTIRDIELALGDGVKRPTASEWSNRVVARKSLVALRPIRAGEAFDETNLGCKRQGGGLPPSAYWSLLGRPARHDYAEDDVVDG